MIVDGRGIARAIQEELTLTLQRSGRSLSLGVYTMLEGLPSDVHLAIEKFLGMKKKMAENIGVSFVRYDFEGKSTTDDIVSHINDTKSLHDGLIVQSPMPPQIAIQTVRNAVPYEKDVDLLGEEASARFFAGTSKLLPPVVGAIDQVLTRHRIIVYGKEVVVVGSGMLVGKPAACWFEKMGAQVTVVNRKTPDVKAVTKSADIVVLGAGVPGLLTPDMVRDNVIIIDAGTSEEAGKLVGDADPACAGKAFLMTPVPGGIGPITVALIFKNLFLSQLH